MELPRATKAGASENPGFLRAGGVRHEFLFCGFAFFLRRFRKGLSIDYN
ncbi:MAG: hypothetical protein ACI9VS_003155 [Candidatus Binatia bacterium]|jgi:hypothetical protein